MEDAPPDENMPSPALEAPELAFKEVLTRLVVLQTKDREIGLIKDQAARVPIDIDLKNQEIGALKKEFEDSRESYARFTLERKNLEMDLAKKEEEIKKHAGELQMVKSNDAYKALLSEMGNLRNQKDECETRILEAMDHQDQSKRRETAAAKTFETKKKEIEAQIAVLNSEQTKLEERLQNLEADREKFTQDIPAASLSRYEKIRARRGAVAMIALTPQGSCGGCQMSVTQQVLNNLLKDRDLVICENCQRILYIP